MDYFSLLWKLLGFLFAIPCGLMGLLLLGVPIFVMVTRWRMAVACRPVRAVILSKTVRPTSVDCDGGCATAYRPEIEYRYEVDGISYTSRNVVPGGNEGRAFRKSAEAVVAQYHVGEAAEAYYDPHRPSEAFLIRRSFSPGLFVLACVGGMQYGFATIMAMGAGLAVYFHLTVGVLAVLALIYFFRIKPTKAAKKEPPSCE